MQIFSLFPWGDWLALAWFFAAWVGYSFYASRWEAGRTSLLSTTNRYRSHWMLQSTSREVRVLDGIIIQNLSSTPSFFCSTTILVIGGLLALLGSTDKAAEFIRDIPFTVRTSVLIFDFKVVLLLGIFVYAFFRFSWSMRLYTFVALVIGSMPDHKDFTAGKYDRTVYAERASRMLSLAAEAFNAGLRGYYFSFAVIAWFFSPLAFACATAMVILILYSREYRSDVLEALK